MKTLFFNYNFCPDTHVLFQFVYILILQTNTALRIPGAHHMGLVRSMDTDSTPGPLAHFIGIDTDEPGTIGSFDFALAIAEIMCPGGRVINFIYIEGAGRRLHIATFLFLPRIFSQGAVIGFDHSIFIIQQIQGKSALLICTQYFF